ncbi:MAG: hypothetical protein N2C14_10800 [Planctomycetales bacterium]
MSRSFFSDTVFCTQVGREMMENGRDFSRKGLRAVNVDDFTRGMPSVHDHTIQAQSNHAAEAACHQRDKLEPQRVGW